MKPLTPEEFFRQVAIDSGINDLQTTRDFFYGMIRTITRELRERQVVALPDLGEFYIYVYPERNFKAVNDGVIKKLPPRPVVKFKPDYKVKKRFYRLSNESTVL